MLKKSIVGTMLIFSAMVSICLAQSSNLANSVDNFSWKYFNTLDKDENIFYSPYSITTALSVVANGAEKQTLNEFLQVLNVNSLDSMNESYQNFRDTINENYHGSKLTLLDSNLILINKDYAAKGINTDYKAIVEKVYKSTIRQADFKNNIAVERQNISNWVAQKTNNFIPNYKSIVNPETVMDILNVVYFKGDWNMPFSSRLTRIENFTNKTGEKIRVEMMNQTFKDRIKYYEDDKYQAIELPYKRNNNGQIVIAMYLLLPIDSADLNIADKWNDETLKYKQNLLKNVRKAAPFDGKVYVKVPKFELDIENNLVKNLQAAGIKRAFTNNAEFFKMVNDTSLKIDNAKHRAKIKVDETGTEAAAITEIGMLETTAAMPEPEIIKNFYANRPFLFVIKDIDSDVELFTGVVNKLKSI